MFRNCWLLHTGSLIIPWI